MRIDGRVYNSARDHRPPGPGGGRGGGLLLADGLQTSAESGRSTAPPARVPEPALHDTRTNG